MTGTEIAPIGESAFAMMENDAEERALVEQTAERVVAAGNWFARKMLILEFLEELDTTSELAAGLPRMPEFAALFEEAVKQVQEQPTRRSERHTPQTEEGCQGGAPDPEGESEEDLLPSDPFAIVTPIYVGAILERLNERRIECLEQAAIYALSTHEQHQVAASAWFNAEPKRLALYRKFMKANPRYRDALERVIIADAQLDELEGEDDR